MKKTFGLPALFNSSAVMLALCATAQAQITFSSSTTISSWAASPTYTSLANSSLGGASTGQGDPAISGSYGVMAETFTPSSSFTLGSFDILTAVNTADTYEINLYDLGPAGTVSVSSSSATYTPGTDLFSVNTVALSTTSGEVQGEFTLPVADQVTLSANEEYALEIWTPTADGQNGILWYRGSTADPGGQMFSDTNSADLRATLAGNGQAGGAPRTGALALYSVASVPEPSSLALIGGALALVTLARRPKK